MANFEIYRDADNEFRWRFQANNGRIMAESGEGYNNQANCQHAILLIKQQMANATISDEIELGSSTPAAG